jgi:toxin-antitoxin system PIN domain toxin
MIRPRFWIAWKGSMVLTDVNVLIYAQRPDAPNHSAYRQWLEELVNSDQAYGVSEAILGAVVRIVTHPRIYRFPTPLDAAMKFASDLRSRPNAVTVSPGPRHWETFERLCRIAGARGNLVQDAYWAALAIESGSEWITTDRDFSRFPGLRWRHPLPQSRLFI